MDNKEELLALYSEFMKTKENFVNRSFATNKFYVVAVTIAVVVLAYMKEFVTLDMSLVVMAVSVAGMAFSALLWANQDAYAYLIKLKFNAVIDEMEKQMCFQPCIKEKEAIVDQAKRRKNYVFADVQKLFALVLFAVFLAAFLWDFAPRVYDAWMKLPFNY